MLMNNEEEKTLLDQDIQVVDPTAKVPTVNNEQAPAIKTTETTTVEEDPLGLKTKETTETTTVDDEKAFEQEEQKKRELERMRKQESFLERANNVQQLVSNSSRDVDSKYKYRHQGDDTTKWVDTLKFGVGALLMSGVPAIGIAAAAATWLQTSDRQHRAKQIGYLEEQGFSPQNIDEWVSTGDQRFLQTDDDKFLNVGGGLVFNKATGKYEEMPERMKKKEFIDITKKDGSVMRYPTKEDGSPDTEKGFMLKEAPLKEPKAPGTEAQWKQEGYTPEDPTWKQLGIDPRIGIQTNSNGEKYKVVQGGPNRLTITPLDPKGDGNRKEISSHAEKQRDASYEDQFRYENDALKALETADIIDQMGDNEQWRSGWYGKVQAKLSEVLGNQDDVEKTKADYRAIRNDAVIQTMPPGPASDNDVRIFSSGFPDDNWPADKLSSWLRGRAKVLEYRAASSRFKGDYYSNNNGLGKDQDGNTYSQNFETFKKKYEEDYNKRYGKQQETKQPTTVDKREVARQKLQQRSNATPERRRRPDGSIIEKNPQTGKWRVVG